MVIANELLFSEILFLKMYFTNYLSKNKLRIKSREGHETINFCIEV